MNKSIITALALIIGLFTFTSCEKENLTPTPTDTVQAFDSKAAPSDFTQTKNTGTTSLVPENFDITLNYTSCVTGGQSLTVTSDEVNIANGNYTVVWYRNSEIESFAEGITLECVCNIGVRVEVYDSNGELSASASVDVGC